MKCEIGAHLHPWTNPPFTFQLPNEKICKPYIFEYPLEIQKEKLHYLKDAIQQNFSVIPYSYKAARWGINKAHIKLINDMGFKTDTSFCPGVNWKMSRGFGKPGTDYSTSPLIPFYFDNTSGSKFLEIPQTIIPLTLWQKNSSLANAQIKYPIVNKYIKFFNFKFAWFRPYPTIKAQDLLSIASLINKNNISVLQMSFHSSELMPNGSPYNKTLDSIERLYEKLTLVFSSLVNQNIQSLTINEYYNLIKT